MKTLVICRIADQRLRKKIFAKLKNRGVSQIRGVFECEFSQEEFGRLREYLRDLPYGENDCLAVYPLCAVCRKNSLAFGPGCGGADDADWIII